MRTALYKKTQKAADAMRRGATLMQMHRGGSIGWFLVPGGEIDAAVAEQLKQRPDVRPQADGLFPGISQTWKLG